MPTELERRARELLAAELRKKGIRMVEQWNDVANVTANCAIDAITAALQAQQPGEALTWALEQGGVLADWCNTAGDALMALMRAYERRVRTDCVNQKGLDAKPWRCAEYIQAEEAIAGKPTPAVVVTERQTGARKEGPSE